MAEFRTDYKDQLLDSSVNTKRKYDLVDGTGKVVAENVTFEDKTVYTQDGDTFGAAEVNKIHSELNGLNESLKWKLGGSATGKEAITLASSFEELLVIVKIATTHFTFSIPRLILDETDKLFSDGYGLYVDNTNYLGQVRIYASINNVALRDARMSSGTIFEDLSPTTVTTVYYK